MSRFSSFFKSNNAVQKQTFSKVILIIISILTPIILLYVLFPSSFDKNFNGRGYYLFFIWLIFLEFAIGWSDYRDKGSKLNSAKNKIIFGIALILPTAYVFASNFWGLNGLISEVFRLSNIIPFNLVDYAARLNFLPLAIEFLVFAGLFGFVFFCSFRWKGFSGFLVPLFLLVSIGLLSLINLIAPLFLPLQIIVPTTASFSQGVLRFMGYNAVIYGVQDFAPTLLVSNGNATWGAQIVWPCAGIDSLVVYAVVILLFLRRIDIAVWQKVIYFVIGAIVTYFVNVFRIVSLFIIGVNRGDVWGFHDYWAQFYSMLWIVGYILLIVGSRIAWTRLKEIKMRSIDFRDNKNDVDMKVK